MSSIQNAGALDSGHHWTSNQITFAFPETCPSYYSVWSDEHETFQAFSEAWAETARDVLTEIASVCNVTFSEVGSNGQISYGLRDSWQSTGAFGYYPSSAPTGGDVWMELDNAALFNPDGSQRTPLSGGYTYWTILHETLHAMGLEHPVAGGEGSPVVGSDLPAAENYMDYTAMSYNWPARVVDGVTIGVYNRATTLQLYDIAALQEIYGAKASHTGADNYQALNLPGLYCIYDTGGTDTISAAPNAGKAVIDLREGEFSSLPGVAVSPTTDTTKFHNVSIAFGTVIENANGGASDDVIIGNSVSNVCQGSGGNDLIFGDGYAYRVYLGQSVSGLQSAVLADQLNGGDGADGLYGASGHDTLNGGAANDLLFGAIGDDVLIGGTGADTLTGGDGADVFRFTSINDSMVGDTDWITDFDVDHIDLSQIDADVTQAGTQHFHYIGPNTLFTGTAGDLRAQDLGDETWIQGDVDGDFDVDFQINLEGGYTLNDWNFQL